MCTPRIERWTYITRKSLRYVQRESSDLERFFFFRESSSCDAHFQRCSKMCTYTFHTACASTYRRGGWMSAKRVRNLNSIHWDFSVFSECPHRRLEPWLLGPIQFLQIHFMTTRELDCLACYQIRTSAGSWGSWMAFSKVQDYLECIGERLYTNLRAFRGCSSSRLLSFSFSHRSVDRWKPF